MTLNEKMDSFNTFSTELYKTDNEEIRLKMGILVKEMADNYGIKPRLIFGKGNVKAQRARYKKRVMEEQRFQCGKCSQLYSSSTSLKHHVDNKICEKKQKNISIKCPCGGAYTDQNSRNSSKSIHMKTKKHTLYLSLNSGL